MLRVFMTIAGVLLGLFGLTMSACGGIILWGDNFREAAFAAAQAPFLIGITALVVATLLFIGAHRLRRNRKNQ